MVYARGMSFGQSSRLWVAASLLVLVSLSAVARQETMQDQPSPGIQGQLVAPTVFEITFSAPALGGEPSITLTAAEGEMAEAEQVALVTLGSATRTVKTRFRASAMSNADGSVNVFYAYEVDREGMRVSLISGSATRPFKVGEATKVVSGATKGDDANANYDAFVTVQRFELNP